MNQAYGQGLPRLAQVALHRGARPLARIFREQLEDPLASELLFGALSHGGSALVDVAPTGKGGKKELAFVYTSLPRKAKPKGAGKKAVKKAVPVV